VHVALNGSEPFNGFLLVARGEEAAQASFEIPDKGYRNGPCKPAENAASLSHADGDPKPVPAQFLLRRVFSDLLGYIIASIVDIAHIHSFRSWADGILPDFFYSPLRLVMQASPRHCRARFSSILPWRTVRIRTGIPKTPQRSR
jgi:hypothetical protein